MALTTGTRLGPYELQSAIGAGGMGEVYKARDTRAVAALNHPHICVLHDIGEAPNPESRVPNPDTIQFLVMEYLEGDTDNRLMALPIQMASGAQTLSPGALFASRLATGGTGITGFGSKAEYAIAPDGRFLLNVAVDDVTSSPITIVQNWTAGLTP